MGKVQHYPYYLQLSRTLAVRAFNIVVRRRCAGYEKMEEFFRGKTGLEFGGPSSIFKGNHLVPVYDRCKSIDQVNFNAVNVWSGSIEMPATARGKTFVLDAVDLRGVSDESYDFALASHILEHIANPLQALNEWKRVVKRGGAVVVIVPENKRTFDVRRKFVTMEHLEADYRNATPETDLTHLEEIVELHDLRRDVAAGEADDFYARCLNNGQYRCMHHHVFSADILARCLEFVGMEIVNLSVEYPNHIICTAKRVA